MKVLFDLVHPADILFFHFSIMNLKKEGHDVLIVARKKDVLLQLLESLEHSYIVVSAQGRGVLGLASELIMRDIRLYRFVKKYKPDVMVGFGGVAISHVGFVTSTPSISFYDTETAQLQNLLSYPFLTRLHVPECYTGWTPKKKTKHFKSYKEASYFYPGNFKPNKEIAIKNGLNDKGKNFLIRVVAWNANHDLGKNGWSLTLLKKVVAMLCDLGTVHISSEHRIDDEELTPYLYTGKAQELHHVMAYCDLLIGESATMATEAAICGTPAIFAAPFSLGYIEDIHQKYQLITPVHNITWETLLGAIMEMLAIDHITLIRHHTRMLEDISNMSDYITNAIKEEVMP